MDREFFCLGRHITTRGDDDERVRLAVRILQIEPAKEYGRGRCDALAESHSLAHPCYNWGISVSAFRSRRKGETPRFPVKMLKRSKNKGSLT